MFLHNVATAAQQVAILYIIVAVGFICDKTKLYTEKAARLTNDLLFQIVTPAVIIQSFTAMEFNRENLKNLLLSFFGGTVIHLAAIVISKPFFRHGEEDTLVIYKFGCVYGNVGYMVLPLAGAVLGDEEEGGLFHGLPLVFFCSGVLIPFNIFAFTHGLSLMKKKGGEKHSFDLKSLFINPGVISVAIGLPLFILKITLPNFIMQPIAHIANLNTPLAMLMFGTYLSKTDLKKMFVRKQAYLVAAIKLIAVPLVCMLIYRAVGMTGSLLTALTISASAPTANNTVMFSTKYMRDNEAASQTIAIVSFISIITMPIMIALSQLM